MHAATGDLDHVEPGGWVAGVEVWVDKRTKSLLLVRTRTEFPVIASAEGEDYEDFGGNLIDDGGGSSSRPKCLAFRHTTLLQRTG